MVQLRDECELIRASQGGDESAFEELVRRYQKMIHSLTYRMTGSMDDAADLAQETFISAYRGLGSFRGEAKFSSWLYQIGVNLCLNWKNKSLREHHNRLRFQNYGMQEDFTVHEVSEDGLCEIQAALLKLKAKERAAIVLTVFDGLNHAEAAKALNCAETTVSWRIFTARRKLKRLLRNFESGGVK